MGEQAVKQRLPKETRETAVQRAVDGEKLDAIAKDLGVAHMTVTRWLEEAGYYPQRTTKWVRVA